MENKRKARSLPSGTPSSKGETPNNKHGTSRETRDYGKKRMAMPGSPGEVRDGTRGPEARGCAEKASQSGCRLAATSHAASLPPGRPFPPVHLQTAVPHPPLPGQDPMTLVAFVRGRRTGSTRHGEPGGE